jgi:dolichyl-phosphate-mannose-protein mannosyltransferase
LKLFLTVILIYAATFRAVTLDRPFHYDDEATGGAFYGLIARNYLRIPWTETHGIPVLTVGRVAGAPLAFYPDHPPAVPLSIVPLYKFFGVGEWQTRLPSSAATVLAIVALFRLMRRDGDERIAVESAAIFAATPMLLLFGGQAEVLGMPLVLFALLTIHAYLNYCAEPGWRTFVVLAGAFALAAVSDWPAFFLIPITAVHFVKTRPRSQWPWLAPVLVWPTVVFATLYVYITVAAHLPWHWMLPLLKGRTAIGVNPPFTTGEWLRTAWLFNLHLHTLPLLLLTSCWIGFDLATGCSERPGASPVRLLLAWGLLHVLVGRQGVYNHEWWWWPLTPGIAAASALACNGVATAIDRQAPRRAPHRVAAILIATFALWTTRSEYLHLYPGETDDSFTTMDIGRAIQAAAPGPNDLAMLVWSGQDPELWFYGDRPLRTDIWSIDEFVDRLPGGYADLAFGYLQPWPARAGGIVLPLTAEAPMPELRAYLAARHRRVVLSPDLSSKFEVYDLR